MKKYPGTQQYIRGNVKPLLIIAFTPPSVTNAMSLRWVVSNYAAKTFVPASFTYIK